MKKSKWVRPIGGIIAGTDEKKLLLFQEATREPIKKNELERLDYEIPTEPDPERFTHS